MISTSTAGEDAAAEVAPVAEVAVDGGVVVSHQREKDLPKSTLLRVLQAHQ
jgi:thiamine monophosphate synthase